MTEVDICLDIVANVAEFAQVFSISPLSLLTAKVILKHDFKCEISWLTHSKRFSVTCCLKCGECGSDIRVEAAVRARDEDWIVIGCNEKCVWVLEIKTCDGQLSLIE